MAPAKTIRPNGASLLPAGFELAVLLLGPVHTALRLAGVLGGDALGRVVAVLALGGVSATVRLAHLLRGHLEFPGASPQRNREGNGNDRGSEKVAPHDVRPFGERSTAIRRPLAAVRNLRRQDRIAALPCQGPRAVRSVSVRNCGDPIAADPPGGWGGGGPWETRSDCLAHRPPVGCRDACPDVRRRVSQGPTHPARPLRGAQGRIEDSRGEALVCGRKRLRAPKLPMPRGLEVGRE